MVTIVAEELSVDLEAEMAVHAAQRTRGPGRQSFAAGNPAAGRLAARGEGYSEPAVGRPAIDQRRGKKWSH